MRIGSVLVLVWLVIGIVASSQRGYFDGGLESGSAGCAKAGTVLVTVVTGPLNYVGLNPKIKECEAPQPSS